MNRSQKRLPPPRRYAQRVRQAIAVASLAAPAAGADNTQSFRFDGGFRASSGLELRFSRPASTLDDQGEPVGPDVMRPGVSSAITGAPVIEPVRLTEHTLLILASGFDHDGRTPLMAVFQRAPSWLDIFTVSGDELLEAEKTGDGRVRTTMTAGDLMMGTVPGKRYVPFASSISCGLIVMLCEVLAREPGGVWTCTSVAFITSQDQGRTWTLLYEDAPTQVGEPRGREWAMQNWWPLHEGEDPLEAWFCAADYRSNPGSTGGCLLLFRATRAAPGLPWQPQAPVRIFQQENTPGEQFHTGAVLPFGDQGIRALVAIGDG